MRARTGAVHLPNGEWRSRLHGGCEGNFNGPPSLPIPQASATVPLAVRPEVTAFTPCSGTSSRSARNASRAQLSFIIGVRFADQTSLSTFESPRWTAATRIEAQQLPYCRGGSGRLHAGPRGRKRHRHLVFSLLKPKQKHKIPPLRGCDSAAALLT